MDLKLTDGRGHLWQWDTGCAVACDGPVAELHMATLSRDEALTLETREADGAWIAPIPDSLLQGALPLRVWGVAVDEAGHRTRVERAFPVHPRPKPSDYVATPDEALRYSTLASRMGELDDLETADKTTLVAAINEAARTGSGGGSSLTDDEALEALDECGIVHPAAADAATLYTDADNHIITL